MNPTQQDQVPGQPTSFAAQTGSNFIANIMMVPLGGVPAFVASQITEPRIRVGLLVLSIGMMLIYFGSLIEKVPRARDWINHRSRVTLAWWLSTGVLVQAILVWAVLIWLTPIVDDSSITRESVLAGLGYSPKTRLSKIVRNERDRIAAMGRAGEIRLAIFEPDHTRMTISTAEFAGNFAPNIGDLTLSYGGLQKGVQGLGGYAAKHRQTMWVRDIAAISRNSPFQYFHREGEVPDRSMIIVVGTIIVDGNERLTCVVCLSSTSPHAFQDEDLLRVQDLVRGLGAHIEVRSWATRPGRV